MTPTPHTNAEALVKHLTGGGYDYRHVQEAAAMLRAQAQEIERLNLQLQIYGNLGTVLNGKAMIAALDERDTLRDERDAFCTEADVLRMQLTVQAGEIERLNQDHIQRLLRIEQKVDALIAERDTLRTENERLRTALEAECGDRCNAEYNPCAARAAMKATK